MPRKKLVPKRRFYHDPVYGSELVGRLINRIMKNGKKSVAERIVYGAFALVEEKLGKAGKQEGSASNGLEKFKEALDNLRPSVEVRSRRVGGATYQVPVEVRASRSFALAMKWLIEAARARSEHGMIAQLAGEILDVLERKGTAIKKLEDMYRMAKANQAFAHFKWNN